MSDISKVTLLDNQTYDLKDLIAREHIQDHNNPHEVTAKQIGAKSIEPDYRITGAAGWYKFLVVPVESNRSRKIVLRLVESYSTVGVAIISMYLNRNSSGEWTATSANIISSVVIDNTDIGYVLNEQDNEVEYYYRKRSSTSGQVLVNILESVARTGGLVDLSEQFESTPVSEFPSDGTYFYPSQDGAGNVISTTYATKVEVNELDAEDVGAIPDTELDGTTATASGAVVSFETESAQVLTGLVVDIDFVQEGSGDPSPDNVRPISGRTEAKVTRTGRNLLNPSSLHYGFIGGNGVINNSAINGERYGEDYYSVANVSEVTVGYSAFASGESIWVAAAFYDSEKTFITRLANTSSGIAVFNVPSNAKFMRVTMRTYDHGNEFCYAALDTAHAYEPYQGETITIPFGDTVYGGTLDVTNGILTITMGSIELSDLDWSDSTSTRYISKTVPGMKPVPSKTTLPNLTAEQYRTITWNNGLTNNHDGITVSNDDNATLLLYKSDSTPEPSGRIVYELTTPIEYTLSPIQVFALQGKNNLWADTGNASVTYRTGKVALLSDVADATEPIQKRIDMELDDDTETVSGAVATFETASTQVPTSIIVNIDPVQEGSGDPSPTNTRLISGWENCQIWVQPAYDTSAAPTKTISLGRTVYGGTLDVLKGKLIVNKAMVMLNVSTSQISVGTTTGGVNYASILYSALGISFGGNKEVQSSNYVQVDSTATAVEGVIKCYETNFRIYDSRFTSKENAKAILDNVQVVYTPEPIEYNVDASIITAFSGQNAMWANTGNISVTYRTGKFALLSDEANAVEPINAKVSKAGDTMTGNLHLGTNGIDRVLLAETSDGSGNIQIYNPSGAKAINMYSLGANAGGEIDVCDAGGNNQYRVAIYANSVDGGIIALKDESTVSTPAYITKEKVNTWDSCAVISSKLISLSLSWSGSGPYTQVVTITGATITSKSMISLQPTAAQISQLITDGVTVLTIENNNGTLTAYAFGATPSIAMVIPCTITEVNT